MSNSVFRFATTQGQNVQWLLRRNCSVSPRQLAAVYVSLCVVSIGIGAICWLRGATLVMPFAGFELLAVGAAFWAYARHAADRERISLDAAELVVELENAGRLQRAAFDRHWARIEPTAGDGSLIEVSGQGRAVRVGRYLRPDLRPALAREIRMALRGA
ncbi:MAG: Putative transmembrane protein [Burkholderiaceae bacterium]|nr:MAG: Putative transmembrane protein [Burkholderiaceae bacterium]